MKKLAAHRRKSRWRSRLGAGLLAVLAWGLTAPAVQAADDAIPRNVQAAVDRGLEWLARRQLPDGRFNSPRTTSTGVSSLATLAFLARGHVPGEGPYGESIERAVDWVLAQQDATGYLARGNEMGGMYDHGISTILLSEVHGMTDGPRRAKVDAALSKAVRVILNAQKIAKDGQQAGGWRYTPTSGDSDLSVTGWQLMALRGAANGGAAVPKSALDQGVAYVRRMALPNGGFSYSGGGGREGGSNEARTGTGILSLELLGQHRLPEAVVGGDYLLAHPLNTQSVQFYYYAVYYCSQAANQLGDKYWRGVYIPLRDTLIAHQRPDGSWSASGSAEAQEDNVYATSMALLALCVPYRYLPLYQR